MSAHQDRPFDFDRDDPERLLAERDPEDLFLAAKALPRWTARALEVADGALLHWASSAHARPRDRQGLAQIHRLIQRLQVIQPLAKQESALKPEIEARYRRWDGYAAMVQQRVHAMDRHDPEEVSRRAHMPALREALAHADPALGVATQDLIERLRLSKARVSQLISLAEAAGLVETRKEGRMRRVLPAGMWHIEPPAGKPGVSPMPSMRGKNTEANGFPQPSSSRGSSRLTTGWPKAA